MRISDWSSDVCSSDLTDAAPDHRHAFGARQPRNPVRISDLVRVGFIGGLEQVDPRIGLLEIDIHDGQLFTETEFLAGRIRHHLFEQLAGGRSEEHTSELQSLMRISYAVFCLKKKKQTHWTNHENNKKQRHTTSHT